MTISAPSRNAHYSRQPNIQIETDFVDITKLMVKQGLGYAIVPAFCIEEEQDLWKMPIMDPFGQPYCMKTWLKYPKSVRSLSAVDRFIEFLVQKVRDEQTV